jgi:hypothetical protein
MTDDETYEFENALYWLLNRLAVLAAPPAEACELQGHYNVACETALENRFDRNLFGPPTSMLPTEVRDALLEIDQDIGRIPPEVLAFTDVRSESLKRMQHPSWESPRAKAKALLELLKPFAATNASYWELRRGT